MLRLPLPTLVVSTGLMMIAAGLASAAPATSGDLAGHSFVRGTATDPLSACPSNSTAVWTFQADGTFYGRCDNGSWSLASDRLILTFAAGPARPGANSKPGTITCTDQTARQEFYIVNRLGNGDIDAVPPVGVRQRWLNCQPDARAPSTAPGSDEGQD